MRSFFEKAVLVCVPVLFTCALLALVGVMQGRSATGIVANVITPLVDFKKPVTGAARPKVNTVAPSSASSGTSKKIIVKKDQTSPIIVLPAPTPRTYQSSLSEREVSELLKMHNSVRATKDVPPLIWSQELAQSAEDWADTLANRGCVLEHSGNQYGETIYYSRKYGPHQTARTPDEVMQGFLAEAPLYTYETNSCKEGEICGHYTQIMWADTQRVGCAKSLCLSDERKEIWVCHYDPPGNIEGLKPY